jgi:hypothetical protein
MILKLKDRPIPYSENIGVIQNENKNYLIINPRAYLNFSPKESGYEMDAFEIKNLTKEDVTAIDGLINIRIEKMYDDILERIRSI